MRKLYEWVLSWAESKFSSFFLALLSLSEAIFFPIPPDVLLIALCMGNPKKSLYFALVASVFSVLGGVLGYVLGYFAWENLKHLFLNVVFSEDAFNRVARMYDEHSFIAIFTAGFTPIPYKVFTISAGVFAINFTAFLVASAISRSLRFFIVAGLIYIYGERIRTFIDEHFNKLTVAFAILLLLGFLILKAL